MNINEQTSETVKVRTRINKRTEKVNYNCDERKKRYNWVAKVVLKMAAAGETITVPAIKERLNLALRKQIKDGVVKENTLISDINSILKSMGGLKVVGKVEEVGRGRKPLIYAFDASLLSKKGAEITAAMQAEIEKENKKKEASAKK